MKRKAYVVDGSGKYSDPALTQMREVAFGRKMDVHIFKTLDKSARMRDDQSMIDAAAAKRIRKMTRNILNSQKND